jgi:lipoate-protein ligase A
VPRFAVVERTGTAAAFHARGVPEDARPEIWVHHVTRPAVVLGSSQREEVLDRSACRRAGVEIVRRRSGGGAVLLVPGDVAWLDVIVPRDGPGWHEDIHRPMVWLGGMLAEALRDVGAPGTTWHGSLTVHRGKMRSTRWSSTVCFDGLGPGELVSDGAKVVGMSQRRTRHAARLQCSWYSRYDPTKLLALLAEQWRPPLAELAPVGTLPAGLAGPVARRLAQIA